MTQSYGKVLDPLRRLRDPLGIKGERQSIILTNNPSTIDEGQRLIASFPKSHACAMAFKTEPSTGWPGINIM